MAKKTTKIECENCDTESLISSESLDVPFICPFCGEPVENAEDTEVEEEDEEDEDEGFVVYDEDEF